MGGDLIEIRHSGIVLQVVQKDSIGNFELLIGGSIFVHIGLNPLLDNRLQLLPYYVGI